MYKYILLLTDGLDLSMRAVTSGILFAKNTHLARHIGEALQDAYKGELDSHYSKEEYLLRIRWRR